MKPARCMAVLVILIWFTSSSGCWAERTETKPSVYLTDSGTGPTAEVYQRFRKLHRQGRYQDALESAARAYEMATLNKDKGMQAKVLLALFSLFFDLGDIARANRTLAMANSMLARDDLAARAYLAFNEGVLAKASDIPRFAKRKYEEAIRLAQRIGEPRIIQVSRFNIAEVEIELGNYEAARRQLMQTEAKSQSSKWALYYYSGKEAAADGRCAEALDLFSEALRFSGSWEHSWRVEAERGWSFECLHRYMDAEAAYRRSIELVDRMRSELRFGELQPVLLQSKRTSHERLFELLVRQGRMKQALEILELAKARAFLDAFASDLNRTTEAHSLWGNKAHQRIELISQVMPEFRTTLAAQTRSIDEILEAVGVGCLLQYFETDSNIWLSVVSSGRVDIKPLPIEIADVKRLTMDVRADPNNINAASKLGATLLPANMLPEHISEIMLAPDGELTKISFAVLRRSDRFIVEDFVLNYVPSGSAVVELKQRPQPQRNGSTILADPEGSLPHAAGEGQWIARVLNARLCLAKEATRECFMSAKHDQTLHVAAHAGVGPLGPWLRLADDLIGVADVLTNRFAPRFVMLAGCATAARNGSELWGSLAAAFLAAGSDAVVASMFSIDDGDARAFVRDFYEQKNSGSVATAVAEAQRKAISKKLGPRHWGSFMVLGAIKKRSGD